MVQHTNSGGATGGSLSEISSFIKEQREEAKAERAEAKAETKAERAEAKSDRLELEAKLEQQRKEMDAKMEQQRKEMDIQQAALKADLTAPPAAAITDEELTALQARIEGLHVTKLLSDEELFALEDMIADYVELTMSVTDGIVTKDMIYSMPTVAVASKLDKLVGLSAAMAGDAAFARQARRKVI
jgi:hypothetical protein